MLKPRKPAKNDSGQSSRNCMAQSCVAVRRAKKKRTNVNDAHFKTCTLSRYYMYSDAYVHTTTIPARCQPQRPFDRPGVQKQYSVAG